MDERKPGGPQEISDEELGSVTGGQTTREQGDKYYKYIGTDSNDDWNASYLCPNCGRPVRYTGWGRFHCDACDETWWWEHKLVANTESGVWQEISYKDYQQRQGLRVPHD